jgi:hypothetical protein
MKNGRTDIFLAPALFIIYLSRGININLKAAFKQKAWM